MAFKSSLLNVVLYFGFYNSFQKMGKIKEEDDNFLRKRQKKSKTVLP